MTKEDRTFQDLLEYFGMDLSRTNGKHATGECFEPDCGGDKFHLNIETGLWDCKHCGIKGNAVEFMRQLYAILHESTTDKELETLCRKITGWTVEGMKAAGVVYDNLTEDYFIPYFHPTTKFLMSMAKLVWIKGKYHIRRPPNVSDEVPARPLCLPVEAPSIESKGVKHVYVPEGEKDGIALLSRMMQDKRKPQQDWLIIGTPGANTFKDSWIPWFKDKSVSVIYDNDRAGIQGASMVIRKIEQTAHLINVCDWSKEFGTDEMDIREFFTRKYNLPALKKLIIPYDEWEGMVDVQIKVNAPQVEETDDLLPITSFPELIDGLSERFIYKPRALRAIAVTLSTYLSTCLPDKPVWLFLVGPASAGKTTVIDGMGTDNIFQYQVSKFGPKVLVSGGGGSGNDFSLIPRLQHRCLGIKDFTPILEMSSAIRDETFGLMRDAYDGHVSIPYGNGVVRTYPDTHWSCVAGVTDEIRKINNTSMGERFVRINFIDPNEDHIDQTMLALADPPTEEDAVDQESKYDFARRRILGYVSERAKEVITYDEQGNPKPSYIPRFADQEVLRRFACLAEVTAKLRTDVPRNRGEEISYRPSTELGSRLGTQFKKVGQGLCFLIGHEKISDEIYPHVAQVAVDTALPHYYEIVKATLRLGAVSETYISEKTALHPSIVNRIVRDMHELGVMEPKGLVANASGRGGRSRRRWAIEESFAEMFNIAFPKGVIIYD